LKRRYTKAFKQAHAEAVQRRKLDMEIVTRKCSCIAALKALTNHQAKAALKKLEVALKNYQKAFTKYIELEGKLPVPSRYGPPPPTTDFEEFFRQPDGERLWALLARV
jgi:hypothetical protein